jgi:HK97 family phage major capsid protein
MKLKDIKQARAALIVEARATLDKAEIEKRDLTDVEQARYDEIMLEVESKKNAIEREERQIALESDMEVSEPVRNAPQKPETKGFNSFGEQLRSVINACTPGTRGIDERLVESRVASGMGEGVPADGGYLVQTDFSTELLKDAFATGLLASKVRKIPVSANSNGLKINGVDETSRADGSRWGGVQIYSVAEADTVTAKKIKFKQIELKLNKIMGLCYLTDELIADTTALESYVNQAFSEEFGFWLDDKIMNGTGVGEPLGFMKSNSLITLTRDTTVTVKYADITAMWARLQARSKANSVWLINETQVEEKLQSMVVTTTVPAYMPPGGLSVAPYGTLMGRPVLAIEQAPAIGTTGDITLVDLSKYLMIDKGAMQSASSLHIRFLYDEQVLRFTYRCDGMPMVSSPLTTKSTVTVSPFIALSTK